ncbi:cell surface protein [Bacillus toyonensis]|uniref:cell surface protein n=1 Tax=Bacillus toyonensis TaxID=155322 RepID=UPI00211E09A0|nr:cell surface protein [Bacillus toyonensis]
MDKFNIFKTQYNAFNDMLSLSGQEVFVNGAKKYGIITNTDTREFNDKYISTDFPLMRGDYIYYNNMYWMIWNQVTVPRAENYKGIIRQAEHDVIFNLYYADVTSKYLLKCPAIIQRTSDYTQHYSSTVATVTIDSEIHVFVQDTPSTRRIIELAGKSDGEIIIGQRNYDIIGVSIEKKGYLNITCRLGNRNSSSDYVNNIYWSSSTTKPPDWENQIDDTFYQHGNVTPEPEPPTSNLPTGAEPTEVTVKSYNDSSSGNGLLTWSEESKKTNWDGFSGYRVKVGKLDWGADVIKNTYIEADESCIIGKDHTGEWFVIIESIYTDGTTTVYLQPRRYTGEQLTALPDEPSPW